MFNNNFNSQSRMNSIVLKNYFLHSLKEGEKERSEKSSLEFKFNSYDFQIFQNR
jgi:hypothetical protein